MSEAVQTTADFLKAVRASGLVEAAQLDELVAPWESAVGPVPDELLAALLGSGLVTQWQIDQLRKGRHKGFVLGKYRLLRLLGAGGMSSVYLAEHATLHNKVAIKVLPVKRVDQSSYLARFEREAQASARLNHPHIARAFDLDTSGAIHFIVMEYIEGEDLHARVKQHGPLSVREAADFIRQAALGLQYAHDEGLVHRDIKPANLIVDKRGHVKILDLGLALATAEDDASLTRAHDEKVLGTADYLAPEQARDSHKADRRSDIYALGCTLFYLLVGKPPFHKGTLAERIRSHMNEPAPNLIEIRQDVPPAIAELYFRMMEKHPDARQQTAQEIADSLTAWLATTATQAPRARVEPPRRSDLRRGDSQSSALLPRRGVPGGGVAPGEPDSAIGGGSSIGGRSGGGSHVQHGGGSSVRGMRTGSGSGSGIDPQAVSLTPPPSSGSRSTLRLPQVGGAAGTSPAGGDGIRIHVDATPAQRRPAPAAAATKPAAAKSTTVTAGGGALASMREKLLGRRFLRLPLAAWIGLAAALLAAAALAAWLMLSEPSDTDEPSATQPSSRSSSGATKKETATKKSRATLRKEQQQKKGAAAEKDR
jgi:eukaryotic-like serine/threonine-protein kinase